MKRALRLLHQRDLYLRLEFLVGLLVVIVWLVASGITTLTAAEPTLLDAAEGAIASRRAAAVEGRQSEHTPSDGTTAGHVCGGQRDGSWVRALIKGRRQRQTEESARHIGNHRGRDHRFSSRSSTRC